MEKTIQNLIGIEVTEDFKNDVICAFDTTDKEIIVEVSTEKANYRAYENEVDSPIIYIEIDNNKVSDAWSINR